MVNVDILLKGAFVLIWIAGFWFGLIKFVRELVRLRRRTARTAGIVVRVVRRGSKVVVPSPDVEFVDSYGIKHLFESSFGTSWNQWPVGSRVAVDYDPQDPANCELALSNVGPVTIVIFTVSTTIFFAFGFILTIRLIRAALSP
jgi:hypothetical protein